MNAMPLKKHRHKVQVKIIHSHSKAVSRSLLAFHLTADETDNSLIITFQASLKEANIIVTDKNGKPIVSESKVSIYEGKTVDIYSPESDFYTIEITSPTIDITGEITLEEI